MPETMSKFLPAKVISSGTTFSVANQYNVISTGTRTKCRRVSFRKSRLSVNVCPFLLNNNAMIKKTAGATASVNFGGRPVVSVKKLLYAKKPVIDNHIIAVIATVVFLFVALIKSRPVRITVTKKLIMI